MDEKMKQKLAEADLRSKIRHRFWACEAEITSYDKYSLGWDGEGSVSIDAETRVFAINFLKEIRDKILLIDQDYIYPTGDGTIVIDFQNNLDDLVSAEFRSSEVGFFLQSEGGISKVGTGIVECAEAVSFVWFRSNNKDIPEKQ